VNEAPDALAAIGQLPDIEIDIADAALQLARVDAPDADWRAARAHLTELARDAVALAAEADDDVATRAGALAGLLSRRHGYAGDTETYDDPANANLIRVIERRRGLPVCLGVLWLHCARAAGWAAHGVDFPGHFLFALEGTGGAVMLDVFAGGQPLDAADLEELARRVEGPRAALRADQLRPMSTRAVLLRLQNNILLRREQAGDLPGALACAEDMLRIAPDAAMIWQQAARLNQRLDRVAAALRCFTRFVSLVPPGAEADRVRAMISDLRTRLN